MSVINGTNFRLYVDGQVVGTATSSSISFSKETRTTVHKDNVSGYSSAESGQKSYSISFEGFMTEETSLNTVTVQNMSDLIDLFDSDAAFAWKMTTDVTGTLLLSGSGIMTDFSLTAPVEENGTISGTITGTGAVVKATVPA